MTFFRARVQLLVAVVFFGWTFVATKICLQYLKPLELLGLRFSLSLPFLFGLMRWKGVGVSVGRHWREIAVGAILFGLHFIIQVTGMQFTTATNTGWIVTVSPLAIALLARAILGERFPRSTFVGMVVASGGILLLVSKGDLRSLSWLKSLGDWLVLVSAFTWALFMIAVRDLSREKSPLLVTFLMILPVTVVALASMAVETSWDRIAALPADVVLALLFLGIAATAVAHWFFQEGLARVGATEAGTYLYLEPLATTSVAVPYLGEPFTAAVAFGGALVLAGVWLAQMR